MTTTSNNWFFNLKNCEHFNCLLHFCLFSPSIHWLLVFFYIKLGITQRLLSRVAFNSRVYIYRTRYRAYWPLASALYSMSPMYIRLHKFVYELMTAHHYLLLTWCFLTQEKAPTPATVTNQKHPQLFPVLQPPYPNVLHANISLKFNGCLPFLLPFW